MTRIERWLGAPAGTEVERAVDLIVTDDWTTPALAAPLAALGTARSAAPIVLVHDHTGPLAAYRGADLDRALALRRARDAFALRFGAEVIEGMGIQHHVLGELGRVRPGMLVLGNDSHAPTLGAHGALALAAQPTTIAAAIHTGRVVLRVPATVRVRLERRLGPGVTARDVMLTLRGRLRGGTWGDAAAAPRATGRALEFAGPGVLTLDPAERAILANLAPEVAAVTATFPERRNPRDRDGPADGADLVLDLAAVRPVVAPGDRAGVVDLAGFPRTRVDRVFVGTCAGGTVDEITAFADALGDRAAVPTVVAPATARIEARLRRAGVLARLEAAGVTLLPPGCGPCFGFGVGRLQDGEVGVATGPRNAVGRMGAPTSRVHLVAGAAAGAAARTGWLGEGGAEAARGTPSRRPRVTWPRAGNVVRLHGTVTTDDLTPSFVPGIGASSDTDPAVLRRLLLAHVAPDAGERVLRGRVIVADHDFGLGSNRASAVRALLVAGVAGVVARSASPLYAAGARDEGLALVELDDDAFFAAAGSDATVDLDLDGGRILVAGRAFPVPPATAYERALREAGGVVAYLRRAASDGERVPVAAARA